MEYRWDELLDGGAHLYRAGRDFDVSPDQFADLVRDTARDFGFEAVVRADGQFVAFQAARPVQPKAPALDTGMIENAETIALLRAQGLSYAQIGKRFGVPWQTVHRAHAKHVKEFADAER